MTGFSRTFSFSQQQTKNPSASTSKLSHSIAALLTASNSNRIATVIAIEQSYFIWVLESKEKRDD
jgi:hypothetical protein